MTDPRTQLTPHFTLGEMTRSTSHPEIYNVPTPAQVENLTRVCQWLEVLREEYNQHYGCEGDPIRVSSGYRSPKLNSAIGGVKGSNHLEGCAADIRCLGPEQALRYAVILMDKMDEARRPFDEIIVERKYNNYWLHFAVRPSNNRRRVLMLEKH